MYQQLFRETTSSPENNTSYQGGLTEQLASSHQVANGYVEIRVATAPVGDLGEGVSDENILVGTKN